MDDRLLDVDVLAEQTRLDGLAGRIVEMHWKHDAHGSYIEIEFDDRFDATLIVIDGDGSRRIRTGNPSDAHIFYAICITIHATFFNYSGELIRHSFIRRLWKEYCNERPHELARPARWLRFSTPSEATTTVLCGIAAGPQKVHFRTIERADA
jgi:hypothetical protein